MKREGRAWLRTPDARWLLAVFALALVVRVVVVSTITPNPRDGRFDDSVFYDDAARHLADGDGYVFDPVIWVTYDGKPVFAGESELTPTALWAPGYPLTLAALYAVSGDSVTVARFANALFGALTVALVFLIARRLFDLAAAVAAGAALALMPSHVLFTAILLSETYFGFLLAAVLAVCVYFVFGRERPHPGITFGLGVLAVFAGYVRGEFLAFGGVIALLMLWQWRWRSLPALAALAVGALLVITPWTLRNWVVLGEPLVGTTGSGRTMYQGHNPEADGGPSLIAVGKVEAPFAGLPRDEIEVRSNKAASRQAREWAFDHKVKELDLVGRRMWQLFRSDEAGVTWLQSNNPWFSPKNRDRLIHESTAYFWGLAAIAVASAPLWWRRRDARRLVVFAVVPYYMLIFGVLFVGDPRYHYAMYMPLAVFGGAGIGAIGRISAAQWRGVFGERPPAAVLGTPRAQER